MRDARRLMVTAAVLAGLALAGCARRPAQTYTAIDPATGQQVVVMAQPQFAQPQFAQPQYAQPPQPQIYAQQPAYQPPQNYSLTQTYIPPQPQIAPQTAPQVAPSAPQGRGFFSRQRTYAQPAPQMQQPYIVQYGAGQPQVVQQAPQIGGPYQGAPQGAYASASPYEPSYTLDSGDKLRIVVFGQDGISNSYLVDAAGNVNLPLVGTIPARGTSPQQLGRLITARLKQGYVREPHVTVEVEAYRPFFILGEVTNPGQYPYVVNMTAETAIAIAGGFSPRASKSKVELTRNAGGQQFHGDVPTTYRLRPGDTVVVKERWF